MSVGFKDNSKKPNIILQQEEVQKLIKKYKGIKKYMKSSLFQIKTIDKNEEIVSKLIQEYEDDPL